MIAGKITAGRLPAVAIPILLSALWLDNASESSKTHGGNEMATGVSGHELIQRMLQQQDDIYRVTATAPSRKRWLPAAAVVAAAALGTWLVVEGSGGSLIGWPLRPEAALSIGSGLVASVGVSVSFWIIQRREARESEKQAALHRSHLELLGRWMSERDLDRLRLENEQLLVEIIQLRDELQLNFPDVANDLKFVRDYSEDTIGRLDELTELVESLDDRVSDLDVEFARHGPGHRRWWRR